MAYLVLGLDDGEHIEIPYSFGENPDGDLSAQIALKLFGDRAVYCRIEPEKGIITDDPMDLDFYAMERRLVLAALERCRWRQQDAAALMGISPRRIHYMIDRHKINPPIKAKWRKAR